MPTPPTDPAAAADVQATFAATLVDEWALAGLTDAVVCPGSRSTPLALALADHAGVRVHVHHDERSGGFLALGLGLATGRPAVVLTTSGTAAAELHPAVVEADLAGVPLVVCTADRPPELRDVGAPQAIDQVHLFGRSVRWYGDPGVPDAAGAGRWRAFAARAHAQATGSRPGPVHLNLPFREPLVGTPGTLPAARPGAGGAVGPAGPWTRVAATGPVLPAARGDSGWIDEVGARAHAALPADVRALVDRVAAEPRGMLVAGAADVDGVGLHEAAVALGWPVLAEPRSPAWIAALPLVAHADAVVRASRAGEALAPSVIVRVGAPGSSRVVNEWLAASSADEVVVGAVGWSDPAATVALQIDADPSVVLAALGWAAGRGEAADGRRHHGPWFTCWRAASLAAVTAVDAALGDGITGGAPTEGPERVGAAASTDETEGVGAPARAEGAEGMGAAAPAEVGVAPNEPAVARAVVRGLPAGAHLVVSSSMPIRDVERYARPREGLPVRALTVHANRGANGIDGVVSTAVGVAAGSGAPTGLLIGDVAVLHDSNGLLGAAGREIDLVCVVVDNDGGGIFSFLPQASTLADERFEALFGTPHGLDVVALAAAYGVDARRLAPGEDVAGAVAEAAAKGGVHVLVVGTDRRTNVDVHHRIDEAVAVAVDQALASGDT
jgi:2-succinyl-5-enolpyruvyl-6-hydroxy-3-cyclohexene-1-carboxylate synthase